jgi:hypothetical protein
VGGSGSWTEVEATIYSAEWIEPRGEDPGCWQVTYSYRVGDDYYSGHFTDFSSEEISAYRKGEMLGIEYLLKSPAKSRVPGATSYWKAARVPMAIGAFAGLTAILIYFMTHHR